MTFDELTCDEEVYKLYKIIAKVKGKEVKDLSTFIPKNISLGQIISTNP